MPARRIACWLLPVAALWACGESDRRPPATSAASVDSGSGTDGSGGSNDTGGSGASGGTAAGAMGDSTSTGGSGDGSGGTENAAGAAGANAHEVVCGDGLVEAGEDCEPEVFTALACDGFGYQTGLVQCHADCSYDFAECAGVEDCFDGEDNDGDEERDCDDSDCQAACQSSCEVTGELPDGRLVTAHNRGHAAELSPSCAPAVHGPELVYAVEVAETGVLEVLVAAGDFPRVTVSVRTACDDDGSELSCGGNRTLAPVSEGDTVFVVVQGVSADDQGAFELFARSRPENVCGDGAWDAAEACEDGNRADGDGCDANCQVEPSEQEPNQEQLQANEFSKPFYAEISPASDEDWVEVEIAEGPAYIIASTLPLGANGCAFELMDPYLELRDSEGDLVEANDDFDSTCAKLQAEDLSPGTYYLRVLESPVSIGERSEFPYELRVTTDYCGNGFRGPLEDCDDGNLESLDGCDAFCMPE